MRGDSHDDKIGLAAVVRARAWEALVRLCRLGPDGEPHGLFGMLQVSAAGSQSGGMY
ncbi:MAG: hypothetical protein U0587_10870 [Candidatus Binatia bacterium]